MLMLMRKTPCNHPQKKNLISLSLLSSSSSSSFMFGRVDFSLNVIVYTFGLYHYIGQFDTGENYLNW